MSVIKDVLETLWKPFDWYLNEFNRDHINPTLAAHYGRLHDCDPNAPSYRELQKECNKQKPGWKASFSEMEL